MFDEKKEFIKKNNFIPSKKMGQNFLINDNISKKIVEVSNCENKNILEIGPGFGAITKYLIKKSKKVLAIELDKRLFEYLVSNFKSENLILLNDDILKVDLDKTFKINKMTNVCVVSNLPYSITSLVLIKFLLCKEIKKIIIMVQKEFASRICAKTNTKEYNALSCLAQFIFDCKNHFCIGSNNFIPSPNVESTIIELDRKKTDIDVDDFSKFLRQSFLAKRKKLINNLKSKFNVNFIKDFLEMIGLSIDSRPENLTPSQFYHLYLFLKSNGTKNV